LLLVTEVHFIFDGRFFSRHLFPILLFCSELSRFLSTRSRTVSGHLKHRSRLSPPQTRNETAEVLTDIPRLSILGCTEDSCFSTFPLSAPAGRPPFLPFFFRDSPMYEARLPFFPLIPGRSVLFFLFTVLRCWAFFSFPLRAILFLHYTPSFL